MKTTLIKNLGACMLGLSVFIGATTTGALQPAAAAGFAASLLGQTGEDFMGPGTSRPNGTPDMHIQLSNLAQPITKARITEARGVWEHPWNGTNWDIDVRQSGASAELWFEPFGAAPFTITVTYADGTSASATTVVAGGPAITMTYSGKLRDKVGQGDLAMSADGVLDGTFTLIMGAGSGTRTVTALDLRNSIGGVWDTLPGGVGYWALGTATGLDAALLNGTGSRVNVPLAAGGSLTLFASDYNTTEFVTGMSFTLTVTFADGTTGTATTAVSGGGSSPATAALSYSGKLRDKVGQKNGGLVADGQLDGTFNVTLGSGGATRTVTKLELRNTAGGTWDTMPGSISWTLGAGPGLDSALFQSGSDAANFTLAPGGSVMLFAADSSGVMFGNGTGFTLTMTFSDGTSATATTTVAAGVDTIAPSIPTSVSALAANCSQITLSWSASSDNSGGSGMKGYNVYRNSTFLKQVLAPATSTSDGSLTAATAYSYTVSAVDQTNNESGRSAVAVTNTPPCNLSPVANAGPDKTGGVGTAVNLNGSASYDSNGTIVSYIWNFGDGASGTGASVSHSYSAAGTYTVTLTVTDNGSASGIDTALVTITGNGGQQQWSKRFGSTWQYQGTTQAGNDDGTGVAVGASGNIVLTGTFLGTVDFGVGALTSVLGNYEGGALPSQDIFLAKFSPTGSPMWSKRFGNSAYDTPKEVALDAGENIFVTGSLGSGGIDLGAGFQSSRGTEDIFVAKYSANGTHLWSKTIGGTGSDRGFALAVDSRGDVVIGGVFAPASPGVDFGGGPLTISSGAYPDGFVAKYSGTDGRYLWARSFGGPGQDQVNGVAVDANGDVFVTGAFLGQADFGGGLVMGASGSSIFVAKYSGTDGRFLWAKGFGNYSSGARMVVDRSGNVVVTGLFSGTVNFGGAPLTSVRSGDLFVAKFTGAGNHVWSRRLCSSSSSVVALALDLNNNVLVTGSFSTVTDFGGGIQTTQAKGVFVARYGMGGEYMWSKDFGGGWPSAIAVAPGTGILVTTGAFSSTDVLDFGQGVLMNTGQNDTYLSTLAP